GLELDCLVASEERFGLHDSPLSRPPRSDHVHSGDSRHQREKNTAASHGTSLFGLVNWSHSRTFRAFIHPVPGAALVLTSPLRGEVARTAAVLAGGAEAISFTSKVAPFVRLLLLEPLAAHPHPPESKTTPATSPLKGEVKGRRR